MCVCVCYIFNFIVYVFLRKKFYCIEIIHEKTELDRFFNSTSQGECTKRITKRF